MEYVTVNPLKMMRQPTVPQEKVKRAEPHGTRTLEIRGDSKCGTLDHRSCQANDAKLYYCRCSKNKSGTCGAWVLTQDDWSPTGRYTFSANTAMKPPLGRKKVSNAATRSGVDIANVVWLEVTGLCGLWDGSSDIGNCAAGIMIMACSEVLGWFHIYKKCGPVVGQSSLDAGLGGCGMLTDNLGQWIASARANNEQ